MRTALLIAAALICSVSHAQQPYPTRPVRIIGPQSPGASTDLTARLVAQKLSVALGQPVIVDNRPGAGSIVGTDLVAKATPDGYTLLVVASSIAINPSLHKKLPFDVLRDLAPIARIAHRRGYTGEESLQLWV